MFIPFFKQYKLIFNAEYWCLNFDCVKYRKYYYRDQTRNIYCYTRIRKQLSESRSPYSLDMKR